MSEPITQSDATKPIVIANIGGNDYTQRDLNDLLFAFTLHGIQKNTGIDFHTFASFQADIQGAILSAVANLENKKPAVEQYREKVEASTNRMLPPEGMNPFLPHPSDYDSASMFNSPYGKQAAVPPWRKTNTPQWVKDGMPSQGFAGVTIDIAKLHESLHNLIMILPHINQFSLTSQFHVCGRQLSVHEALSIISNNIKHYHPSAT